MTPWNQPAATTVVARVTVTIVDETFTEMARIMVCAVTLKSEKEFKINKNMLCTDGGSNVLSDYIWYERSF